MAVDTSDGTSGRSAGTHSPWRVRVRMLVGGAGTGPRQYSRKSAHCPLRLKPPDTVVTPAPTTVCRIPVLRRAMLRPSQPPNCGRSTSDRLPCPRTRTAAILGLGQDCPAPSGGCWETRTTDGTEGSLSNFARRVLRSTGGICPGSPGWHGHSQSCWPVNHKTPGMLIWSFHPGQFSSVVGAGATERHRAKIDCFADEVARHMLLPSWRWTLTMC